MTEDFHPDLRRIARVLPRGVFSRYTMPIVRRATRLQPRRTPEGVEVLTLPSGAGVRLHRPTGLNTTSGALLWIHGGGYVIGSPAQDDRLCRRFVQRLNVPVAAVGYRLAPEHPYPAALDDCYDVLRWLARLPDVDPSRIAIGGASAGGGLTAALALRARDRGEVSPLFQLLVYPMVDDRSCDRPGMENPNYRLWNPKANRLGWAAYLRGADPDVAVPARQVDLTGLAPAWLGVGTLDPLHDEGVAYAHRLTAAGVPCEIDTVTGAFHGFDLVAPAAGVSRAFFDRQCSVLRKAFAG
ncbi:alpha/beta hydrolase [Mycobacterium sp. 94-17]|uniref:alpha/beta hydrolase n=1 Tax=Mycobacterium sp. 94-17 TaxID=2986147 RepID=UPI002D1F3817|nr:alpha/beta hydrolase [Mycobacterium sp. 94-17]MEB4208664.1 alpha/beta hydrolase [Mycobacterium sp. 94-17]